MKRARSVESDGDQSYDLRHVLEKIEYIDAFFKLPKLELFRKEHLFPNIKEVTESYGIFHACLEVCKRTNIARNDPNVLIVVIGDGHRARTGVLCSSMSAWRALSIDPVIHTCPSFPKVKTIASKIEDIPEDINHDGPVILCFPHCHASITTTLGKIKSSNNNRHVISMPCCFKDDTVIKPSFSYIDEKILSDKNTINIYLNV